MWFIGFVMKIAPQSTLHTFTLTHMYMHALSSSHTTYRFEGGLLEHHLKLSEGFAAALELIDLMNTTREPW